LLELLQRLIDPVQIGLEEGNTALQREEREKEVVFAMRAL
jgi:hypothetical protein